MGNFFRTKLGLVFLTVIAGVIGALFVYADPAVLSGPAWSIFDIYQSHADPPVPPQKMAIVLVGEKSVQEIGAWPFPRSLHARLIGKLNLARLIVLDIIFPENSTPEDDAWLSALAKESGKVIAGIQLAMDAQGKPEDVVPPYKELANAVLDMGIVNVHAESDGIYRDYPLVWNLKDQTYPSIPLSVYVEINKKVPALSPLKNGYLVGLESGPVQIDKDFSFKIHHPEPGFPIYEYVDVLREDVKPEVFRDTIVFVGVNASGASDYFSIGRGRLIPGSSFIANATQTLFSGWIPYPAPTWVALLSAAILCALGWLSSFIQRWGFAVIIIILVGWVGLTYLLFIKSMIWLSPLPPILPALVATGVSALFRLKILSVDWEIQRISIDSLLFLGRQDFDPSKTTFADFLWNNWSEIEKWSNITLVFPLASLEEINNAGFMEGKQLSSSRTKANLGASIITSKTGIRHLLLELPELESGEKHYSLLAWHGRLSVEVVKSVAALILSAAMHFKALEENQARKELFYGLIDVIIGAVDAKDPTTAGHSRRVADLSKELAEAVGVSDKELDDIHLGGLLHDVGKIGIPDYILNKPGKLDASEMAIMRSHPGIGEELMSRIKLPEAIMKAIVEHHERLDGRGYPKGLKDHQLSLPGRILKIADVYDALSSKRQYKEQMSNENVREILIAGIGTDFDESLMKTFMQIKGLDKDEPEDPTLGPTATPLPIID
ncbi:MAG: CHASE2 domain-containing protein [Deltaproteobacteria bacterium]|jgi:putative nucleotidyltransferase with HDIG domain|nr:CHASE2 domain-containing protein [Deltaproteobacteria bacterium]